MKKIIILWIMLSASVALASNCDNSTVTIENNTSLELRVISINNILTGMFTTSGYFKNIYEGQILSSHEVIKVTAFSSKNSSGEIHKSIVLASDKQGTIKFFVNLRTSGFLSTGTCKASVKADENGLSAEINSTDGKPAHAELKLIP